MPTPKQPAKGRYDVVDDVFRYTSKNGYAFTIDLDLPADLMKVALDGEKTEDEQFAAVQEWMDADTQAAFDALGILERARFMRTFFAEFAKAAELPLGESLSSSTS